MRAAFAICRAARAGISPRRASTSASATSTSSQHWRVAWSFQIARMAGVPKRSLR